MPSDFAKRMEELSRKMSNITSGIAEESFKPTQSLKRNGAKLPKSHNRGYRQFAWGVSPRVALALRFDCDPWTLKKWKNTL